MKQILAITGMNLRTILQRSGASIVIIIGIAGSVAVMVSLLTILRLHLVEITNTYYKFQTVLL